MTVSTVVDLTSGPEPAGGFEVWAVEADEVPVLNGATEHAESASNAASSSQRITAQA
jgi:hypothetical protein